MKNRLISQLLRWALCAPLLFACTATGLGPSAPPTGTLVLLDAGQITPRTKGGTLTTIVPRTKGGTLSGGIVWPAEVKGLDSKRFDLKVYAGETLLAQGQTDADGRFVLWQLPSAGQIRIEASVPGQPYVRLRRLVDLREPLQEPQSLSMLTTAASAILLSLPAGISPQRLLEPDILPILAPLAQQMTPWLDQQPQAPIETQPAIARTIAEVSQKVSDLVKQTE